MGKVHLTSLWVNHGQSRTGPVRDLSGVALARPGPGVPVVPCNNPVRDQSGNVRGPSLIIGVRGSLESGKVSPVNL